MKRHWQPRHTAPKDGTEVLAYSDSGKMAVVYYNSRMQAWVVSGTERLVLGQITHWQPLPPTPAEEPKQFESIGLSRLGRLPTMEEFMAYGVWMKELLQSALQNVTIAIADDEGANPERGDLGQGPFWLWVPEQEIWIQVSRHEIDQIAARHYVTFTSRD